MTSRATILRSNGYTGQCRKLQLLFRIPLRFWRQALPASGLLSGGFEDQPRDFLRVRDQREMAGLHLDGLGAHSLGHEALEVRIDGAIFRRNGVVAGLGSPAAWMVSPARFLA
jgi:hypothetical protein